MGEIVAVAAAIITPAWWQVQLAYTPITALTIAAQRTDKPPAQPAKVRLRSYKDDRIVVALRLAVIGRNCVEETERIRQLCCIDLIADACRFLSRLGIASG